MTLIKSNAQTVKVFDGNQLQVFINIVDGQLYLKDYNGNIQLLSDYVTASGLTLQNVGNGVHIYTGNTGLPAELRTLVADNNIDITQVGDEIHIAVTGLPTIGNVGTGAEIYKSGTNNPFELKSIKQGINVLITQNADEIEIAVPSVASVPLYFGSFFSTNPQSTLGNVEEVMTYNNTDISSGVSIVNQSQITLTHTGIYNIQFSAQIVKTQGGSKESIYIYLKKNGNIVGYTNTQISLENNNSYVVAAWNFFVSATAGDFYEIAWYTTDQHIQLYYSNAPFVGLPEIPSVILTVNRVG